MRRLIQIENFDSLEAFIYAITYRPMNDAFVKSGKCSSERGSLCFTETSSWQEAQDLLAKGYEEGLNMILNDNGGINDCATRSRIIRKVDFVGQRPHIVNTIMGRPKTMVHRIKKVNPTKTITIIYDNDACADISASSIIRAGKNFLALVKFLEANDYRVEIKFGVSGAVGSRKSNYDTEAILPLIKIKEYKQPLNPLMLAYPLVHPSFLRRHVFRYIETSPYTNLSQWTTGYGHSLVDEYRSIDDFRNDLVNHNVIDGKSSFYMNWSECEKANEIDDMLTSMKFNK